MTHGYHSYRWIQEIPVRHEQPSRGHHVNQGGETNHYDDSQSIASFANANKPNMLVHSGTGQQTRRLRLMRHPEVLENQSNQNYSSKITLQPRKNLALQQQSTAPRGQLALTNLKTWESTGSLAGHDSPTYENVRIERSFSHPRTTHSVDHLQSRQPVLRNSANNRSLAKQMSIIPVMPITEIQSREKPSLVKRHSANPFHHPFFYSSDTEEQGYGTATAAETAKTKRTQGAPKCPNVEEKPGSQYDNETEFFTISAQKPTLLYKPSVETSYPKIPVLNTIQRNATSKPPLQLKRSTPKQTVEKTKPLKNHIPSTQPEKHLGTLSRQHIIVDRPVDDGIVYTEIKPDTLKRNSRASERPSTRMRSRSPSPIIYAEIEPSDNHERLRKFPMQNNYRHNKKVFPSSNNEQYMPVTQKEINSLRFSSRKHQNNKNLFDQQDSQSQNPSEYSISLGTPRLELRRMKKAYDNNNNQLRQKHSEENEKTKPFPNSSSLEQMLSDSGSSKKSGTIKSVLKAPSDKFPNMGDARGLQRSPKRVTIKEQESQALSNLHPSFRSNPSKGFTRPIPRSNPQIPPNYISPDNHFKVINRRVVRAV
ncbi:uncharacterized protein [Watersipora subatra]|uniref:uncharacterized protein n=1 Tax=Watersipora subatra TaxID=2589382 RepID=UPI00355C380F